MRYKFELTGKTSLLMHANDVLLADEIESWRKDPRNQKVEGKKAGDDRSPGWTWATYLYRDDAAEFVTIPIDNLQSCLMSAGARILLGKGTKTLKESAVSQIMYEGGLDLTAKVDNAYIKVPYGPWLEMIKNQIIDFREHLAAVKKAKQFDLHVKRATVGPSKHVRVRPIFRLWKLTGAFTVSDPDVLTEQRLVDLFKIAGTCGLGDWRPNSPKRPGQYGMFSSVIQRS